MQRLGQLLRMPQRRLPAVPLEVSAQFVAANSKPSAPTDPEVYMSTTICDPCDPLRPLCDPLPSCSVPTLV